MRRAVLLIGSVLLSSAILSGCGGRTAMPPAVATTVSPDAPARPLLCLETSAITYHLGKITPAGEPDLSADDIRRALERPDAVAYVRRLTGDTSDTIARIKIHNAVVDRLCNGASP